MVIELQQPELSFDNIIEFQTRMDKLLNDLSEDVVFDFKNIRHLDSTSIGQLIVINNKMKSMKLKLTFINVNKLIQTVFKLGKLNTFFDIQ